MNRVQQNRNGLSQPTRDIKIGWKIHNTRATEFKTGIAARQQNIAIERQTKPIMPS